MTRPLVLFLALALPSACGPAPVPADAPKPAPKASAKTPSQTLHGELTYTVPQGWQEQEPTNSMRLTQFRVKAAGSEVDVVIYKNIGGTVQQNIDRWIGQMGQAEGVDPRTLAVETQDQVGSLRMTTVELPGSFTFSPMMGGNGETLAEARLLGTMVETPYGTYQVKVVGPDAAVLALKQDYQAFLRSMEP